MTRRKRFPYSALPDGQFVRVWTDSVDPQYYYGRIKYHRRNDKGRPVGITAVETLDPRHLGDWYRRPRGWYAEMGTEFIEPLAHLTEQPTKGSFICGHPNGSADELRYCTATTVEGTDRCDGHTDAATGPVTPESMLVIARINGSSSSRRQKRLDNPEIGEATIRQWAAEGYNVFWTEIGESGLSKPFHLVDGERVDT
ncbi:hypothetical protein ABZ517_05780 [Streptomyces scabiei]|uniref:hypothetical protein n=1 Tax=Streptomyces scabiei TaxID=1930 RepID=UPI0033DC19DD